MPVIFNGRILAFDWTTHFVTYCGEGVLTFRLVIQTLLETSHNSH